MPSDAESSAANNKLSGAGSSKPGRPSLAKTLLSLDGNLAKQQALSHVLNALQITYARWAGSLAFEIPPSQRTWVCAAF